MKIFNEITLSILLIVLTVLFLDPFMLWMPGSLVYVILGLVIAVFAVFAGLVWREKPQDERDHLHRMIAGRIGYLFGAGILVFGIVYQVLFSHPDPWMIIALVGMILGKLLGLVFGRAKY